MAITGGSSGQTGSLLRRIEEHQTATLREKGVTGDLESIQKIAHNAHVTVQSTVLDTREFGDDLLKVRKIQQMTAEALERLASGDLAPSIVREEIIRGNYSTIAYIPELGQRIEIQESPGTGITVVSLLRVNHNPDDDRGSPSFLLDDVPLVRFSLRGSMLHVKVAATFNTKAVLTATAPLVVSENVVDSPVPVSNLAATAELHPLDVVVSAKPIDQREIEAVKKLAREIEKMSTRDRIRLWLTRSMGLLPNLKEYAKTLEATHKYFRDALPKEEDYIVPDDHEVISPFRSKRFSNLLDPYGNILEQADPIPRLSADVVLKPGEVLLKGLGVPQYDPGEAERQRRIKAELERIYAEGIEFMKGTSAILDHVKTIAAVDGVLTRTLRIDEQEVHQLHMKNLQTIFRDITQKGMDIEGLQNVDTFALVAAVPTPRGEEVRVRTVVKREPYTYYISTSNFHDGYVLVNVIPSNTGLSEERMIIPARPDQWVFFNVPENR